MIPYSSKVLGRLVELFRSGKNTVQKQVNKAGEIYTVASYDERGVVTFRDPTPEETAFYLNELDLDL